MPLNACAVGPAYTAVERTAKSTYKAFVMQVIVILWMNIKGYNTVGFGGNNQCSVDVLLYLRYP